MVQTGIHGVLRVLRNCGSGERFLRLWISRFNLETAVGRARVGCAAVGWQGATTRRAPARKAEQRRQRAAARLNRVRSAFTQKVMGFV